MNINTRINTTNTTNTSTATTDTSTTSTTPAKVKTFITTNKFLENFLYFHKVRFSRQGWNDDGMTCWEYNVTPRFLEVLEEYRQLYPAHVPTRFEVLK